MDVVYGHTDSIYVKIDSVEKAQEVVKKIDEHVKTKFPNVMGLKEHPVSLEFEKYYKTLGVGVKKNRNAGYISWKDGNWLDEPQFIMTGFTAKRASITPLAKRTQLDVLRMWVDNIPESEIVSYCRSIYNKTLKGNIDIKDIIQRTRYRPERFVMKCNGDIVTGWQYKKCRNTITYDEAIKISDNEKMGFSLRCPECNSSWWTTLEGKRLSLGSAIEGAVIHDILNPNNKITDSFLYFKMRYSNVVFTSPLNGLPREAKYIAFKTIDELPDYEPDWAHYAESVVKKSEPIFRAMNWDIMQIKLDDKQKSLDEWF
jgi:DNA polymerase elongation subunit (family B)